MKNLRTVKIYSMVLLCLISISVSAKKNLTPIISKDKTNVFVSKRPALQERLFKSDAV